MTAGARACAPVVRELIGLRVNLGRVGAHRSMELRIRPPYRVWDNSAVMRETTVQFGSNSAHRTVSSRPSAARAGTSAPPS